MPRKSPPPAIPVVGPTPAAAPTPPNPPALPTPDAAAAPAEAAPTFRVGDYEVGDGYFSELSGHPDIIY